MHWLKRDIWKAGIVLVGMLLLVLTAWVPVSAAGASQGASELVASVTGTVQATPTVDQTMTSLQKEQLTLQNDKLKSDNAWAWLSPVSTFFGPLATIGTILVGILVARNNLLQWSKNREDEQKKRAEDQRIEREKRDEERFQKVAEGLGSKDIEARVGSAVALRTFLRPGYEQFYRQTFDLACAYLLLRKTAPNADLNVPVTQDPLGEALVILFRESFPYVRDSFPEEERSQYPPPYFNATGIQLDNAYLSYTDLREAWLREAYLRRANLWAADLRKANLKWAKLSRANLSRAKLEGADLSGADLSQASLKGADPEAAKYLNGTIMHGIKGLTKEQLKVCKAKGAIIDEATMLNSTESLVLPPLSSQSTDTHSSLASPIQGSILPPDIGGSSTFSSGPSS